MNNSQIWVCDRVSHNDMLCACDDDCVKHKTHFKYVPASTVSELVEAVKPLLRRLNDDENYNGDIFKEQLESELAAFEGKK